ncbi:MFS transporter [Acetomicrobium flavidum]|uniref:MFS transporter n=1 Tax=Acetomicrobium flavidum TaxID=49896 RepID=UPI002989BFB1
MLRKRKEILLVLCTIAMIMMIGIGIVSPILPHYARSFGVNITMVGLLITVFGLARIAIDVPAGSLVEIFGRRSMLVLGPALLGVASFCCSMARSYLQLLCFRFLQGLGSGLYTTAAMVMLADISNVRTRGPMMSFYQGAILIGAGLGPTVGGYIADAWGIRAPFIVYSFMAALATIWAYVKLPETKSPKAAKAISDDDIEINDKEDDVKQQATILKGIIKLFKKREFLLGSLVTFSIFFTRTGTQNQLIPLLGADRIGLSASLIGTVLTIVTIFQFIALFIVGKLSVRLPRKTLITPGCILLGIGLVLVAFSKNYSYLLISAMVMGVGIGMAGPVISAYVADTLSRDEYGIGMGLYRAISDIGFVVGPVTLGWLADIGGFTRPILINAAFVISIACIFHIFARETAK